MASTLLEAVKKRCSFMRPLLSAIETLLTISTSYNLFFSPRPLLTQNSVYFILVLLCYAMIWGTQSTSVGDQYSSDFFASAAHPYHSQKIHCLHMIFIHFSMGRIQLHLFFTGSKSVPATHDQTWYGI